MADQDFDIKIRIQADTGQVETIRREFEKLGAQVEVTKRQAEAAEGGLSGIGRTSAFGVSAVTAGATLNRILNEYAQAQVRVNEELDKQGAKVVELGKKWQEAAREALTVEDVRKVAASGIADIDAIGDRIRAIATQDVPVLQDAGDTLVKALKNAFTFGGDPGAKGPYETLRAELIRGLAQQQQLATQQKKDAIELSETYQDLFEQLKLKPIDEAFSEIGAKIEQLQEDQRNLDKNAANYLEQYNKINKELAVAERTQKLLLQTEQERKREAEATAQEREKDREVSEKAIKGASPQVQAILKQESAAQAAREAGRGGDADLFEKSVEAFKRGATPQQLGELKAIEELRETNAVLREMRDMWK